MIVARTHTIIALPEKGKTIILLYCRYVMFNTFTVQQAGVDDMDLKVKPKRFADKELNVYTKCVWVFFLLSLEKATGNRKLSTTATTVATPKALEVACALLYRR